jgi:hypothetical protein
MPTTTNLLTLGSRAGGGSSEHFNGTLDDVRIYNRALNFAEIAHLAHPININFQLTGSPIPAGYLTDGGDLYAARGNGQTYGWNLDHTDNSRDRNNAPSPINASTRSTSSTPTASGKSRCPTACTRLPLGRRPVQQQLHADLEPRRLQRLHQHHAGGEPVRVDRAPPSRSATAS